MGGGVVLSQKFVENDMQTYVRALRYGRVLTEGDSVGVYPSSCICQGWSPVFTQDDLVLVN